MFKLKKFFIGVVVGLCVGLWAGVNIGRDQPIWANPFEKKSLSKKASEKANEIIKDAKRAVRESLEEEK